VIEPTTGPESPRKAQAAGARPFTPRALVASVLVAAIVGGAVATGVTLGVLRLQARTNPQTVDLGNGVTISEDSATASVAEKAAPAVVSIVTRESTLAHGSGFVVTSDGYLVTNVAVIANSQALTVVLGSDHSRHDARLVDADCQTGLAVLKVDQVSNLPTLSFGDSSSLRLGQNVVVLGGSLNDRSAARGIVSGVHGSLVVNDLRGGGGESQLSNAISTDATIDSGTSGGPLLNVGGQVVGLSVSAVRQAQPLGVALPASDLQPEVEQIVQTGQLVVPTLDVQARDVGVAEAAVRGSAAGARITAVTAGGLADRAGLKAGDVITQIDDQKLDDAHPLTPVLRDRFKPDQRVTVSYARGGSVSQVQLTLRGEHPTCP
jgi:S1-C subfamily serine protease